MTTQGERQEFLWRPNTNDSTNLARYDQEAQLWTNAFRIIFESSYLKF
jgi:hypothetical protein